MIWVWISAETLLNISLGARISVSNDGGAVWHVRITPQGSSTPLELGETFATQAEAYVAAAEVVSGTYDGR
jgi:hypothetical protein